MHAKRTLFVLVLLKVCFTVRTRHFSSIHLKRFSGLLFIEYAA